MFLDLYIEAQGLIFDASQVDDGAAISYFTSLAPLQSGTVMAGWQCGREKHAPDNTIRLARSRNQGRDWELLPAMFDGAWQGKPGSYLAAEMVEPEQGRLMLFTTWVDRTIRERPLFNPVTEGILPTRLLYCESTDEGDSWSDWAELPTADLTGCAITGPVLRWDDGVIACAFESFKEFDDPTPVEPAAWLAVSRDGGRSFEAPWVVARHPQQAKYYWDQRLCPTQTVGEFIGLFWTHLPIEKRDANVHFVRASIGNNGGTTEPFETCLPGQIVACCLADELLLAFAVDRERPATLTLWQSIDRGVSWPESARLVVYSHDEQASITQGRENIDYAQYWEDMGKWSFGHPAIRPVADGWLLAWYAGTPERMSIHWARVKKR